MKLDDKIIHRLAVARLLDGNAAYTAVLKHRLLTAEKSRQIIGDHLVFVSEASATGQFGGWCLFFSSAPSCGACLFFADLVKPASNKSSALVRA